MGRGLAEDYIPGTFKLKANASNDYDLSRERQKTVNYTGIGAPTPRTSPSRRAWARSTTAPRSTSGSADTAIIQMRRLLLEAVHDVEEGRDPVGSQGQGSRVRPAQMYLPEDAAWTETQLKEALVARY